MFARARKAVFAGLTAGLTALQLATLESSADGVDIAVAEWRNAAIAAVLSGFLIYQVPNDTQGVGPRNW